MISLLRALTRSLSLFLRMSWTSQRILLIKQFLFLRHTYTHIGSWGSGNDVFMSSSNRFLFSLYLAFSLLWVRTTNTHTHTWQWEDWWCRLARHLIYFLHERGADVTFDALFCSSNSGRMSSARNWLASSDYFSCLSFDWKRSERRVRRWLISLITAGNETHWQSGCLLETTRREMCLNTSLLSPWRRFQLVWALQWRNSSSNLHHT